MLNGILVVDKPEGPSSHDVVSRLRRILGEKRIGHGGTLDPIATGVLPVLVGRATRASDFLLAADKAYTAHFRLGITTDTQDITGNILTVSSALPTAGELRTILRKFTGAITQVPPMYSAIKVGGRKLYEMARSGIEVKRQPREVTVFSIDLMTDDSMPEADRYSISVHCSKGTYIRTLINDIGAELGCGATLTALRRTKTGAFDISMSRTLDEIEAAVSEGSISSLIIPVDSMFTQYPETSVDASGERLCRNGALVPFGSGTPGTTYRVYGPGGNFLMLGLATTERGKIYLKTVKNFFDVG